MHFTLPAGNPTKTTPQTILGPDPKKSCKHLHAPPLHLLFFNISSCLSNVVCLRLSQGFVGLGAVSVIHSRALQ